MKNIIWGVSYKNSKRKRLYWRNLEAKNEYAILQYSPKSIIIGEIQCDLYGISKGKAPKNKNLIS